MQCDNQTTIIKKWGQHYKFCNNNMKRVYRTWVNGEEKLVKASSKKIVRERFGVSDVEFWCNITKKHARILENVIELD